ncbi:hypothetical protein GBA52_013010 [Prunus armeniaca]|nr:hypothetical protein GBA52_013010 [Prunus armeniaca]
MQNPFEAQTVSKLESEHAYALVTTRGSYWETMPLCYSAHMSPHTPAVRGCPKR